MLIGFVGGPSRARTGDQRIKSRFRSSSGVLSGPELSNSAEVCDLGIGHPGASRCTTSAPWIRRPLRAEDALGAQGVAA